MTNVLEKINDLNPWVKGIIVLFFVILITFLFKYIILILKTKGDFDWWNTYGGKKYSSKLDMKYLLSSYSDPLLYKFFNSYQLPHQKLTNSQADFIVGSLLRYQTYRESTGDFKGVLTPRSLVENILPEPGGEDRIYNAWVETQTDTSRKSYPSPGDINGWKDLIMEWLNNPYNKEGDDKPLPRWFWCRQQAGGNTDTFNTLLVPTPITSFGKCPSKAGENKDNVKGEGDPSGCYDNIDLCECGDKPEDLYNCKTGGAYPVNDDDGDDDENDLYSFWFIDSGKCKGRPDNIFARMNIFPTDPMLVYFVNNTWTAGGTLVDANAFKRAVGDGGGIIAGGWLGFIQGMGDLKSSDDYANYIWTNVESKFNNPIDYSVCGESDTTGGLLGLFGGLLSGAGLGLMVPGAAELTVGGLLGAAIFTGASATIGWFQGSQPSC